MKRSVYKEYWYLFYNALITSMLGTLLQLTDTYFIGRLGEEQLAGAGLAFSFSVLVWVLLGGVTNASVIDISKSFGANFKERLKIQVLVGTVISVMVAIPLFMIMYFGSEVLFKIFSAEPEVMGYLGDYYHIWIFLLFVDPIGMMYSRTMTKINLNGYVSFIRGSVLILNAVLNYILIFGVEGLIEPMGVKGAATGTVIASVFAVIAYWAVLHKKGLLLYRIKDKKKVLVVAKKVWGLAKHFVIVGSMIPFAYISINAGVSHLPTKVISTYTVVDRMYLVYLFVIGAAGSALQTLAGRYHGAKQRSKTYKVFLFTQKAEVIWVAFSLLMVYLVGDYVGALFFEDVESIELFKYAWSIMLFYWLFWGLQGSINSLQNTVGNVKYASMASFGRNVLLLIFPYLCARFVGMDAFLFSMPIITFLTLIWVLFLYKKHLKPYFEGK